MKKLISLLMMILLLLTAALAETSTPTCTTVTLATGSVQVYDFGENRLHAYVSGDALGDVCGRNVREDVISEIFSRFCVGK